MAMPNREAIETFMSITGASELVAIQKLEVLVLYYRFCSDRVYLLYLGPCMLYLTTICSNLLRFDGNDSIMTVFSLDVNCIVCFVRKNNCVRAFVCVCVCV